MKMKTLSTAFWLGLGVFAVGVNSVYASPATASGPDENKRFRLRESRQELFDQEEGYDDYDYYPVGEPQAITVWWVLFHNPQNCQAGPGNCDPFVDGPRRNVRTTVFYATGGVTDPYYGGSITLAGIAYTSRGIKDLTPPPNPTDINPVPPGTVEGRTFLGPDFDPEVLLVVRTHGPQAPDEADFLAQIMNFNDPLCGTGNNDCFDAQGVRFLQGEQGRKDVFDLSNGEAIGDHAFGFLNRQGDALQFVIQTKVDDGSFEW